MNTGAFNADVNAVTNGPLAALVEIVPMPLVFFDRELRCVYANQAAAEQVKVDRELLVSRPTAEVLPALWPNLRTLLERVLAGETITDFGFDLRDLDNPKGSHRRWLGSYYPVTDDGEIIAVACTSMDVTELHAAKRELEIRNDLFAMLAQVNAAVNSSRSRQELFDAVCEIAYRTGNFQYAWVGVPGNGQISPVASAGDDKGRTSQLGVEGLTISTDPNDRLSKCPTGQAYLTGKASFVNDYFETPETEPWREVAKDVGFFGSAAVPIRQDGEVVAVLAIYAHRRDFFTPKMLEVLEEITPSLSLALERFELERRRRLDETALELRDRALSAATQGVSITDFRVEGDPIIYASPALDDLFGYAADEIVGLPGETFLGAATDRGELERLRGELAKGQLAEAEILTYRKSGEAFWNRLTISPVLDENGELTHAVAVHMDVTEQHMLENRIRQAQRMEAIGQLAGGVAHDFNNALTAIRGSVDLALTESMPDSARQDLKHADEAAEHATQLTRQLLAFSRQQVLQPQSTDLNRVVKETAELVRRIIGDNVELDVALGSEIDAVLVDRAQLQQVIINLAVNARDAMPDGGVISLATANHELGQSYEEHGFVSKAGPYVMLEVRDTGHGMDEATQSKIFEPFYTTKVEGTGLGLATVYGIVSQSGGHIEVESAADVGSTFKIYLPTTSLEVAPEKSGQSGVESSLRGTETILHVDDSEMLRPLVQRSLSRQGYNVLSAADAEEALAVAKSLDGKLDLVITDVVMPGLNGRELAERLLADYPHLGVIFTSGYPSDKVIRAGIAEAEVSFIEKPFLAKDLLVMVRSILDAPQPAR